MKGACSTSEPASAKRHGVHSFRRNAAQPARLQTCAPGRGATVHSRWRGRLRLDVRCARRIGGWCSRRRSRWRRRNHRCGLRVHTAAARVRHSQQVVAADRTSAAARARRNPEVAGISDERPADLPQLFADLPVVLDGTTNFLLANRMKRCIAWRAFISAGVFGPLLIGRSDGTLQIIERRNLCRSSCRSSRHPDGHPGHPRVLPGPIPSRFPSSSAALRSAFASSLAAALPLRRDLCDQKL